MKNLRRRLMPICGYGFAIAGLLLTVGALADPNGLPPLPDRLNPEHAGSAKDPTQPPLPGAMIEAHLAFIKTALKLTDAQLPIWNGVADALREQAKRRDAQITARHSGMPPADLPAALQDRQRLAVEEAEDLSKLLIALKPFYAMLSTEQKETADHLFPPGPPGPRIGGLQEQRGDSSQCQQFFRHEVR